VSAAGSRPGKARRTLPYAPAPFGLVALSLLLAGCAGEGLPGRPNPENRPVPAENVKDFDRLYATNCAGCHGENGNLGPAPPLNDTLFLGIVPDAELHRVIADGRPGTLMPPWSRAKGGVLTAEQVEILAGGIKKRWNGLAKPEADVPPYLAPDGKAAGDKAAGAEVFMMACANCHGDRGQGTKKIGAVNDRALLALLSDQALRRIVITGRPDLDMPDFRGHAGRPRTFSPLTSKDVSDVVALLAYWRVGGTAEGK
jgi:mono/diheme cytochrome c family protein